STVATRSSSSSTTSTSSRPPTGSSTSARRVATGAAGSSPRERPRRWGRAGRGRIAPEGPPEKVAPPAGAAPGEYLARVLRGEPLVPLSDVTFAEEAGRRRAVGRASAGSHRGAGAG